MIWIVSCHCCYYHWCHFCRLCRIQRWRVRVATESIWKGSLREEERCMASECAIDAGAMDCDAAPIPIGSCLMEPRCSERFRSSSALSCPSNTLRAFDWRINSPERRSPRRGALPSSGRENVRNTLPPSGVADYHCNIVTRHTRKSSIKMTKKFKINLHFDRKTLSSAASSAATCIGSSVACCFGRWWEFSGTNNVRCDGCLEESCDDIARNLVVVIFLGTFCFR